jgi:hypothetical protein
LSSSLVGLTRLESLTEPVKLEIEGDTGYLTLADVETRDIKDDVKLPEGEMGEELEKVFAEDKEVRKLACHVPSIFLCRIFGFLLVVVAIDVVALGVTLITCQGEEGVDSFKVVDGK